MIASASCTTLRQSLTLVGQDSDIQYTTWIMKWDQEDEAYTGGQTIYMVSQNEVQCVGWIAMQWESNSTWCTLIATQNVTNKEKQVWRGMC